MGSTLASALGVTNTYGKDQMENTQSQQGQIFQQQSDLAKALQDQVAGKGPNPAQTQYKQNVQNNIANAQGLIASQRGLNPALAAKMGTNLASAANQQAGAQSSILQQQQQLGASRELAGLYGQMQAGNVGMQNIYAQGAAQNAKTAQDVTGGIIGGMASGAAAMAHGGMVPNYAEGGTVFDSNMGGPSSAAAQYLSGITSYSAPQSINPYAQGESGLRSGLSSASGGGMKAMLNKFSSSGPAAGDSLAASENVGAADLAPAAAMAAHGGQIEMLKQGGHVPGKAHVRGDSLKNDTVPAMLSPGEIVIPRTIATSEDAPEKAAKFVAAVLARKKTKAKR